MSREARLKRLGLWHLKDDEKALDAELKRQLREDHNQYNEYLKKQGLKQEPLPDDLKDEPQEPQDRSHLDKLPKLKAELDRLRRLELERG